MPTRPDKPTRREFIAGLAAASVALPLASCGEKVADRRVEQASSVDMFDALKASEAQFVDSEGNLVNLNALQTRLWGNPSTMSFMFANCIDVCPITASVLHSISESTPALRHVIVSTSPEKDFENRSLASVVEAQGLRVTGPNANTIILFPTGDGTTSRDSLTRGFVKAFEIQHKLQLWTNGRDASGHSGAITLFDAEGKQLVQATNDRDATPMIEQLNNALNRTNGQRR